LQDKKVDLPAGILTLQRTDRWVGVPLCEKILANRSTQL